MAPKSSGLFRRFLAAFLGLSLIPAGLLTGAFLFESRRAGNESMNQFQGALVTEARRNLRRSVQDQADRLDLIFTQIERAAAAAGPAAAACGEGGGAADPFGPIARNARGSWSNPATAPTAVFAPRTVDLTPEVRGEIRALADVGVLLEKLRETHASIVQTWFQSARGPAFICPNRNLAETIEPDFDARASMFYVPATPAENPDGRAVWTDLYNDPAGMGVMVSCIVPVRSADGTIRGVAGADVTLRSFEASVAQMAEGWECVFVVDRQGRLLFGTQGAFEFLGLKGEPGFAESLRRRVEDLPDAMRPVGRAMAAGGDGVRDVDLGGSAKIVAFAPVRRMGWSVGVVASRDAVLEPAAALASRERTEAARGLWTLAVFAGGFILLATALAWRLARTLAGRLEILTEAARAVSAGDFEARVPDLGHDEIGFLAATMNRMLQDVRRSQRQMVQTEKLTALGTLVSGICHELNNLIGPILGFAEMMEASGLQGRQLEQVRAIQKAAKSAKDVVDTMLGFGRGAGSQREPCDLNKTMRAACDLVAPRCRSCGIELDVKLDPALPESVSDGAALQQAFLNVLTNAVQEMASTGGTLAVRSAGREGLLTFTVEDSGPGIPPENLGRIFDPFFTTKPPGQGTGLGLSLALSHVRAHGGEIFVENLKPRGARFTFRIPRVRSTEVRRRASSTRVLAPAGGPRRRVLLVEDDLSMRAMLTQFLSAGLDLSVCSTGREAMGVVDREPFDLILSDIKMRDVTGRDLYEYVKRRRPEVAAKFLFITGDTFAEETREFLERERVECLRKPFELRDLQKAIERRFAAMQGA